MLPERALVKSAVFAEGSLPPLTARPWSRRAVGRTAAHARREDLGRLTIADWKALNAPANGRLTTVTSPHNPASV